MSRVNRWDCGLAVPCRFDMIVRISEAAGCSVIAHLRLPGESVNRVGHCCAYRWSIQLQRCEAEGLTDYDQGYVEGSEICFNRNAAKRKA